MSHGLRAWRLFAVALAAAGCAAARGGPDATLVCEFDPLAGRLAAVHAAASGERFLFPESGLRVETGEGVIDTDGRAPVWIHHTPDVFSACFQTDRLELIVGWRIGTSAIERSWTLRHRAGLPIRVIRSEEIFRAAAPFRHVVLHTDGSVWAVPVNLFLRSDRMSLAVGMTYPWVELSVLDGNAGARLACDIESEVPADGRFESDTTFLVACPRTGLLCDKGGGVTRLLRLREPEPMDWGEVWAMQEYVAGRLGEAPLPESGFFAWMDGWWARLKGDVPPREAIDRASSLGVSMFCLPQVWYGHGEHPGADRALEELRPGARLEFPPEVRNLIAHAREKGVRLGGYCQPACPQFGRDDWLSRREDGAPNLYIGNRYNCLAVPDYERAFVDLQSQVIADTGTSYWAWDGRLISYAEADNDPPPERHLPVPCFAKDHGHPPGRQFFAEYRAIRRMIAELRKRHPGICLETYWGLKRGIPWVMEGLNAVENYYEAGPPLDQRLQCWYNQQYRFLPPPLNWTHVDATEPGAFETSLISAISESTHALLGTCYRGLDRPENVAALKRWRGFADRVRPYLGRKRDLFGQPGTLWVDGSAHCRGDRGLLFLFRSRYTADPGRGMYHPPIGAGSRPPDAYAAVPLDWRIGLTAGSRFRVVRLHPGPVKTVGVFAYGESAPFAGESDAEVYAIVPDDGRPFELDRLVATQAPSIADDFTERLAPSPVESPHGPNPPLPSGAVLVPAFREGEILEGAGGR